METIPVIRADGVRTVIHAHRSRIDTSSFDGPGSMAGLMAYRLPGGSHVNVVDGKFVDLDGHIYTPEN